MSTSSDSVINSKFLSNDLKGFGYRLPDGSLHWFYGCNPRAVKKVDNVQEEKVPEVPASLLKKKP